MRCHVPLCVRGKVGRFAKWRHGLTALAVTAIKCDVSRTFTIPLIAGAVLCTPLPHARCEAAKSVPAPHVWWAPDSSWAVMGFGRLRQGLAQELIRRRPPELDGLKIYEMEINEPALYLGIELVLKKVEKVVFTKNTKVIVLDTAGRRVESDGIFFCPDFLQTSVYDSRKWPVVVSKNSVWCHPKNGCPCGWVKFPTGSVELNKIASFEVVGAVVQDGDGKTK